MNVFENVWRGKVGKERETVEEKGDEGLFLQDGFGPVVRSGKIEGVDGTGL